VKSSVQSSTDQQKLSMLVNTPGAQVYEKDGSKMIIVPETKHREAKKSDSF